MGLARFEWNIQTPWTLTDDTIVGATTDASVRPAASLPRPGSETSSSDANTIYLDPVSGSDANTGFTTALAKLTIAGAVAAVTSTRDTIHIINEAATGSTNLQFSSTLTNVELLNIQSKPGKRPIIIGTGNEATTDLAANNNLSDDFKINGIEFQRVRFLVNGDRFGHYCTMDGCGWVQPSTGNPGIWTFRNSLFVDTSVRGFEASTINARTLTIDMASCVLVDSSINFTEASNVSQTLTLSIENNTFIRSTIGSGNSTAVATTITTTLNRSNIWIATTGIVDGTGALPATTSPATYSLFPTIPGGGTRLITTDPTNIHGFNPLFLNEAGGDYRLAHVGRQTSSGVYYPLTSVAVGAGGTEIGAFQLSASQGPETVESLEIPVDWGWKIVTLERELVNYQEFNDLSTKYNNSHDGGCPRIQFELEPTAWVGSDFSMDFCKFLDYNGPARYYPNGDEGIFGAVTAMELDTTVDPPTILLDTPAPRALRPDFFKGWVAVFDDGSGEGWFEILSHTGLVLTTQYLRGFDYTATPNLYGGTGTIQYMPCRLAMSAAQITAEYYSEYDHPTFLPWHKAADAEGVEEFHTRTIIIKMAKAV